MKFILALLCLLATADTLWAHPIPAESKGQRRGISIPWRKIIPPVGTLAIIGGLAGLVYLGTKADEAYAALKTLDESEFEAKYQSLDSQDQVYLDTRSQYIGRRLTEEEKATLAEMDEKHGWPNMEMPDTRKMNQEDKHMLEKVHGRLRHALEKLERTNQSMAKAVLNAERAKAEQHEAQLQAAVIAATDWKQALHKVQGAV